MKILILNEAKRALLTSHTEKRCAASPNTVAKLTRKGIDVFIEQDAGALSLYEDKEFEAAGAHVVDTIEPIISQINILLCVNSPNEELILRLANNAIVIGHIDPFFQKSLDTKLCQTGITTVSVEMIPRTSRAQKMDALSSQASLAGYVMVMKAVANLPSILPMMMTPSGTIKPAKIFIIGAGVAGLQAIATAKRLGASVLAYDTRPVVAEQVESLGAKFLKIDIGDTGETKDGYAKELTEQQKNKLEAAQQKAIADSDIVITTAQLFGRKPPLLIKSSTLEKMRLGSVVVDMAAQSGGNVEGSKAGETIKINGITLVGNGNWSQDVARDATDMYANNIFNLLDEFIDADTGNFLLDLEDDILANCVITHNGAITNDMLTEAYKGA